MKKGYIIADVILVMTAVVYISIYLISIYYAFAGFRTGIFTNKKVYGTDAFQNTFFWLCLVYAVYWVLPVSVIYDIIFFIYKKVMDTLSGFEKNILIANAVLVTAGIFIFLCPIFF